MLKQKRVKMGIMLLLAAALLAGCTPAAMDNGGKSTQTDAAAWQDSLETAPVLDYEVPLVLPGILINQIGYEPSSFKMAVVSGKSNPGQFRIVDAVTGEVVFTGALEEQGYEKETEEYNSYGDFSAFTKEGTYYIECDTLGRSYTFEIKEKLYDELLEASIALLSEKRESFAKEDIKDVCRAVSALLLSYELYGTVYDSKAADKEEPPVITEIKACVDWLMTMQDVETGAVMDGETPKAEETAWLSAVLAKFSYTYQKYDSVYATVCLQAADKAWHFLDKNVDAILKELTFYAAAELYRATGQYKYHQAVKNLGAGLMADVSNEAFVFGTLTYASTRRKVDVDMCAELTSLLFTEAESIAQAAGDSFYMVGSDIYTESTGDILWDMVVVSSIDYIITNHEYATMIENHQNYLAGENEAALCYITDPRGDNAAKAGIGEDCVSTARYIMLLSEIMSHRQEE